MHYLINSRYLSWIYEVPIISKPGGTVLVRTDIRIIDGRHPHGERKPWWKDLIYITASKLLIGEDYKNFKSSDAEPILYRAVLTIPWV